MKTAAIVIEAWKLEIFTRRLCAGSYSYTQHPGIRPDWITLKVPYDGDAALPALAAVVKSAQLEAHERCAP